MTILIALWLTITCSLGGHKLVAPDGWAGQRVFVSCRCSKRSDWMGT